MQPPVIFVPGITATKLEDYYPIPPQEVWSAVLHKEYERISLHPADVRYEAIEPARVQPTSLFDIIYEDLVQALRHDLSPSRDEPTPVFAFAYDWRQDCTRSADQLRAFVEEVRDRTVLLPHYREFRPKARRRTLRVDLVGHSMGGLIIADYLKRYGDDDNVRRVVSLGTPFQGSVDAVLKLSTGMGTLTGLAPRDREREAARTIPALYQLLPTYAGAVEPAAGYSADLFDLKNWQPSVLDTLEEYIRLHKADIEPETLLRQYLDTARRFRDRTTKLVPKDALPEAQDAWLALVGVNAPTQVKVKISLWKRKPWFEFIEDKNDWPEDPDSPNTGDGTVPFLGACSLFLPRARLVCVSPDDFDRWEIKDRLLAASAGFHAALPTVNLVQRLVVRFLRDDYTGDVWGRIPPEVKPEEIAWPKWLVDGTKDHFDRLERAKG